MATSAIPFALRFVPFFVWYGKRFGLPGRLQTIVTLNDAMSRIRKVSEQLLDEKTKLVDKDDTKGAKDVLSVLVRTNTPDENGNVVFSREQMSACLFLFGLCFWVYLHLCDFCGEGGESADEVC